MISRKFINVNKVRYYSSTIDKEDVKLFSKLSTEWWNENGPLKPLHSFNKLRIPFIRDGLNQSELLNNKNVTLAKPLRNLNILDVGCGGGILSEPLSRLGANITGLDADNTIIKVAKEHSIKNNLNINYIASSIEDHAEHFKEKYDAVVASEIIEHVNDKSQFIESCVSCLKPNGAIFLTTMNRTFLSELLGIKCAECMGIVPKGAHQIEKFVQPHELQKILEKNNCGTKLIHGMMYVFITNTWHWISNTSINYGLFAIKYQ